MKENEETLGLAELGEVWIDDDPWIGWEIEE